MIRYFDTKPVSTQFLDSSSLVPGPRPKFFAYVTRRKDGSAKNLGLVSTAGVLVRMRMHYPVMEAFLCTVASVQA